MAEKRFTLQEASESLQMSEKTIKRYLDIFQTFLGIERDNFEFAFTQEMIDKILRIRQLLKKPSYEEVKALLDDEDYWERLHQVISKHEDKLSKYGFGLSLVGTLIEVYSLIKDELADTERSKEIQKLHFELSKLSDEIADLRDSTEISSHRKSDIILLAGAGVSNYLGLPSLNYLLKQATFGDAEIAHLIRKTSFEGFHYLIDRLKLYSKTAEMLRTDCVFREWLGSSFHSPIYDGVFELKCNQALNRCYRALFDQYGPNGIEVKGVAAQATLKLLEELAKSNAGCLHIYTTTYDCSYQVLASTSHNISFLTHIDNKNGAFTERWNSTSAKSESSNLPLLYVHRLHGCVTWFTDDRVPFRTRELCHADDKLDIDDGYLHRMCIELGASQSVGTNPALNFAFEEFCTHLREIKLLLVWGYEFRDSEVLQAINQAFLTNKGLSIYYLNSFLNEMMVMENIKATLRNAGRAVHPKFKPRCIGWSPTKVNFDEVLRTLE